MPTLEPRFEGLTKQGKPTVAATRAAKRSGALRHSWRGGAQDSPRGRLWASERQRDARLGRECPEGIAADDPAPVTGDADRHDGVTAFIERGDHRRRGGERHLVLPGAAAEDDAHAQATHTSHSSST